MERRKFLTSTLGLPIISALAGAFPSPAVAQAWPARNITMIVPFPPGGQADLAARPVAAALEKILGRPVVVDNRQGAGGAVGNAAAARSEPDGHTLLMALSSVVVLPEADRLSGRKPSYELDQLVPIARVLADPGVLPVLSSSPYKTLQDLVGDARKRPGEITFSSSGNYGAAHIPYAMFQQAAGIKLLHVPYRGGGPITAQAPGPVKPYVDEGRVRLVASWGGTRTAELANVPTFIELGYPDVEFYIWAGLFVPRGTPAPIVDRLRDAMREVMRNPQVTSVFERAGSPPAYLDAPDFARFIDAESARLVPTVKKIGRLD